MTAIQVAHPASAQGLNDIVRNPNNAMNPSDAQRGSDQARREDREIAEDRGTDFAALGICGRNHSQMAASHLFPIRLLRKTRLSFPPSANSRPPRQPTDPEAGLIKRDSTVMPEIVDGGKQICK